MTDNGKIMKAGKKYLDNPYWAECYNDAPSDVCKRYILLWFYISYTLGKDGDAIAEKKGLEKYFDIEDWKYIAKYAGNNPFGYRCRQMVKKLSGGS